MFNVDPTGRKNRQKDLTKLIFRTSLKYFLINSYKFGVLNDFCFSISNSVHCDYLYLKKIDNFPYSLKVCYVAYTRSSGFRSDYFSHVYITSQCSVSIKTTEKLHSLSKPNLGLP